jgi:hypothetical protein
MPRKLPYAKFSAIEQKPIYVITYSGPDARKDGRRSTGTYEIDFDRMLPVILARDIAEGQYAAIDRVYEAIPGGLCTDVTEDFAFDALKIAIENGTEIEGEFRAWLENHLGCDAAREAEGGVDDRGARQEHGTLHRAQQGI